MWIHGMTSEITHLPAQQGRVDHVVGGGGQADGRFLPHPPVQWMVEDGFLVEAVYDENDLVRHHLLELLLWIDARPQRGVADGDLAVADALDDDEMVVAVVADQGDGGNAYAREPVERGGIAIGGIAAGFQEMLEVEQ